MRVAGHVCLCVCAITVASAQRSAHVSDLPSILANQRAWGPAFPAALRQMPAWTRVGESEVIVYHDRLVGSRLLEKVEGERLSLVLDRDIRTNAAVDLPMLNRWWGARASVRCQETDVRPAVRRDRVVLQVFAPDCEFIAKGLTSETLMQWIGRPESVRTRIVNGREDRSEVLTLYGYADGAVTFVESNDSYRVGGHHVIDSASVDPDRIVRAMAPRTR